MNGVMIVSDLSHVMFDPYFIAGNLDRGERTTQAVLVCVCTQTSMHVCTKKKDCVFVMVCVIVFVCLYSTHAHEHMIVQKYMYVSMS